MVRKFVGMLALATGAMWALPAPALSPPPPAAASVPAQTNPIQRFVKANEALNAWIQDRLRKGEPLPMASESAASALLRSAFDETALPAMKAQGFVKQSDFCMQAVTNMAQYLSVGVGTATGEQARQIQGRNMMTYQDEVSLGLAFNISCTGAMAELSGPFLEGLSASERTATRREGAQRMKRGILNSFLGLVGMQQGPDRDFKGANLDMILDSAVRNVDSLSAALPLEHRRQIVAAIDAAAGARRPGTEERFRIIRRAMTRTDCGVVCAF